MHTRIEKHTKILHTHGIIRERSLSRRAFSHVLILYALASVHGRGCRNDIVREIARPRTAPLQALAKEALDLLREADSCWDATFATGLADRGNAALNGAPAPRGADGAALKGVAGNAGLLGQGDVVMRDAGEGARRDGAGGVTGVTLGGLGSGGPGASLSGWLQT